MASGGSDLSTRMSAENTALRHFKIKKVAISNIIKVSFPFFEVLRDHGFYTEEMYKKSKKSFEKSDSKSEFIYHVLSELEKKFSLSLMKALFSNENMDAYPDLKDILETFKEVIPNIELFLSDEKEKKRSNIQQSLKKDTVDSEKNSNSEKAKEKRKNTVDSEKNSNSEKAKKKKRRTGHTEETFVNFDAEILPVTCGEIKGILIKRKLKRGGTVKCIRTENGKWFNPREFEVEGGYEKSSNWKISVYCGGKQLKCLIEDGNLTDPPHDRKRKPENAAKCKICGDEGRLFKCSFCLSFFHEYCHIPSVETESKDWICTFCKIEVPSGKPQHVSYSEIIAKRMGPKEKSKCVFLLLKLYCHLEKNIFQNIPEEHYVQKASQCLETLKSLDEIKNKLNGGHFTKVKGLVLDMKKICQDPKHNDSVLTEEEFEKNFKEVFSIQ